MHFNADDIEAWASEYADLPSVQGLVAAIELDRKLPQPGVYPAGSPMRMLAEQRQTRLALQALKLGYRPAGKEMITEVLTEVAKAQILGAVGLEGTGVGDLLDKAPLEKRTQAEKDELRKKERERKAAHERSGDSLGLERRPW